MGDEPKVEVVEYNSLKESLCAALGIEPPATIDGYAMVRIGDEWHFGYLADNGVGWVAHPATYPNNEYPGPSHMRDRPQEVAENKALHELIIQLGDMLAWRLAPEEMPHMQEGWHKYITAWSGEFGDACRRLGIPEDHIA